ALTLNQRVDPAGRVAVDRDHTDRVAQAPLAADDVGHALGFAGLQGDVDRSGGFGGDTGADEGDVGEDDLRGGVGEDDVALPQVPEGIRGAERADQVDLLGRTGFGADEGRIVGTTPQVRRVREDLRAAGADLHAVVILVGDPEQGLDVLRLVLPL